MIRNGETDQLGKGSRWNLSQQGTESIKLWLEKLRNPQEGQLFKGIYRGQKITGSLGLDQISHIYKRLAKRANLNKELIEHISGHSLRVGHAQDMLNSGESMPMIMSKGR